MKQVVRSFETRVLTAADGPSLELWHYVSVPIRASLVCRALGAAVLSVGGGRLC